MTKQELIEIIKDGIETNTKTRESIEHSHRYLDGHIDAAKLILVSVQQLDEPKDIPLYNVGDVVPVNSKGVTATVVSIRPLYEMKYSDGSTGFVQEYVVKDAVDKLTKKQKE